MKMGGGNAMVVMDDMGTGQNRGMSQGSGGGMGKMGDQGEMGGMSPGGRSSGASAGMGMMDEGEMGGMSSGGEMGMCCMGEMGGMRSGMMGPGRGMGGMKGSSSTMPGQPGASHLYHIGSTGFFLDHAKHITLTPEQKMTLNRLKEKALLGRTAQQRRIDQAEQELYMVTGADQPDTTQIQAKVAEIEKLRADQRMNLIRAVGEAANVLTHDQHQALLGTMSPNQKVEPTHERSTCHAEPKTHRSSGPGLFHAGSFVVEFRRRPVTVHESGVAGGAERHGGYVPENGGLFENGYIS